MNQTLSETTEYMHIAKAACQHVDDPSRYMTLVVVGVKALTTTTLDEIGRRLWQFSGRDAQAWDRIYPDTRIRWAKFHVGRYKFIDVTTNDDGTFDYYTGDSSGHGYPVENFKVVTR